MGRSIEKAMCSPLGDHAGVKQNSSQPVTRRTVPLRSVAKMSLLPDHPAD